MSLVILAVLGPLVLALWSVVAVVGRCERCGGRAYRCSFPFRCRGPRPEAPPRVDD